LRNLGRLAGRCAVSPIPVLPETRVLITSEMGRRPRLGDPRSGGAGGAGRDHWIHCLSVLRTTKAGSGMARWLLAQMTYAGCQALAAG
jgi:hypothetical protein